MLFNIQHTLLTFLCFDIDSSVWLPGELLCLPAYTYAYQSPKDFWVGICMLITVMNPVCIRSQLLSSTSEHKYLIDSVLNALDSRDLDTTCFWPLLQIFATLLNRLDWRIWQLTQKSPYEVCKMFLSHQVFIDKLQQWSDEDKVILNEETKKEITSDQEDWVSNSQMVYEWSTRTLSPTLPSSSHDSRSKDEDACSPHVVVFMWVLPFIHSLLEFGDVLKNYISQVLSAISSIFSLSLSPKPYFKVSILTGLVNLPRQRTEPSELLAHLSIDGLSNKSLHILAQLIEMLFTNGRFSFLLEEKKKWLPIFSSVCEVVLSGKLSGDSTYPCSQSFKLASSVLPSSIVAVRKTMYTFFNNSVGQQCEIYSLVVVYFSPKLNRSTLFTPPLASNSMSVPQLTVENLQEAVLNILKTYQSNQDITGPFLPFGHLQDSVKKSTIVKQEVNYDEEPGVKKSTIVKQEVNYDEEPVVKKSTIVKQEVNYDEELSEVIVKKEVNYDDEPCEMECGDELPDSSTLSLSPESSSINSLFGEPSHQINERTRKTQLNPLASETLCEDPGQTEDSDDSVEIVAVYPAKNLNCSSSSNNSLPSFREMIERAPVRQQQQNATKLDISRNEKKSSTNKMTKVGRRKPLKSRQVLFKSSSSNGVPTSDWSNADSNNISNESATSNSSIICLDDSNDQCNNSSPTTLKKSSLITSSTPFLSSPEFSDDDDNEAVTKMDTEESKQADDKITDNSTKIKTPLDNAKALSSQASDLTNWCSNFDASSTLESLGAIFACVEPCKTINNKDSTGTSISTELASSDYPHRATDVHPMDGVSESDGKLSPFLQSPDSQTKADYVFEDISTQVVDSMQLDSNSSDEENAIATAARKSEKDSDKLECTPSQPDSLSSDSVNGTLDSSFVEEYDKDEALVCMEDMSTPVKQVDPFELLSQDPDAYNEIPRTTPLEIRERRSMKRTDIASDSVLPSAKKKKASLSISDSESEPSDGELDSTKTIPQTIYNKVFLMPTCASSSSFDLIMPTYKRVRPLKLKLRRLQSNDIKKIKCQIQEKKILITPRFERYKRQCEAFLEAQGVPQSHQIVQDSLIVTVPLSFLPTRKSISEENNSNALCEISSDEVFTDTQVSVRNEYLVTSSGGTTIALGHGSSVSQNQLNSSIPMRQTNGAASLRRDKKLDLFTKELSTPAKSSNTESTGTCYHAPPFSRSRLPSPIVEKPLTGAKQKVISHATNTQQSSNKKTISRVTTTTHVVPSASTSMTVPANTSCITAKLTLPSSRSQAINLKPKQKIRFEDLFYHFLNWDPDIFLNPPLAENGCPMKPNLILENEPTPVLDVYQCYDQYFKTMKPLLLLELWDMVSQPIII